MQMYQETYLILGFLLMVVMGEWLIPARSLSWTNRHRVEDLFWLFINQFAMGFFLGAMTYSIGLKFSEFLQGYQLNFSLLHWPWWAQFALFMACLDLLSYLSHRAFHRFTALWSLHKLHHSIEELNALSAFRHHWIEVLILGGIQGLVLGWLVVEPGIRAFGALIFVIVCIFQHANLRLSFPRWVHWVIITPRNHYWHHSTYSHTPSGQNFGFFLTFWDRLFGSYYHPEHMQTAIGLKDQNYPKNIVRRLFYPLDLWFIKAFHKLSNFVRSYLQAR